MPGIYSVMDISKGALQVATRQLDVVSHNVANANTPEYSRQEAVLTTRNPEWTGEGMYGRGVKISSVIQHADRFLQARITAKMSEEGYYSTLLEQLKRLEALANETGDTSLGEQITAFFNAWQDVSNNPQSTAVREVLLETASNLTARLNTLYQDYYDIQRDMNGYLASAVEEVNLICRRIAELNVRILANERANKPANDFRDERQRQLNKLANYLNIQWFEGADGQVTVLAGNGKMLVEAGYPDSNDADPLGFQSVEGYDWNQVVWSQANLVMDYNEITSGKMGAWLRLRDQRIPEVLEFLNTLSRTLIKEVNILHSQGAGLALFSSLTGTYQASSPSTSLGSDSSLPFHDIITDGSFEIWVYEAGTRRGYTISVDDSDSLEELVNKINTALSDSNDPVATYDSHNRLVITAPSGVTFGFRNDTSNVLAALGVNTFFDGSSASSITLNSAVASDSSLVAAGRISSDGDYALGDNSNALELADLKDSLTMSNSTQTFNEAVTSWAAELGSEIRSTDDSKTYASTALNELKNLRDDISGVNIDEEMVKMIQYQRAYQLSARLISVADELLITLLRI